jgi:hypothetical protein
VAGAVGHQELQFILAQMVEVVGLSKEASAREGYSRRAVELDGASFAAAAVGSALRAADQPPEAGWWAQNAAEMVSAAIQRSSGGASRKDEQAWLTDRLFDYLEGRA